MKSRSKKAKSDWLHGRQRERARGEVREGFFTAGVDASEGQVANFEDIYSVSQRFRDGSFPDDILKSARMMLFEIPIVRQPGIAVPNDKAARAYRDAHMWIAEARAALKKACDAVLEANAADGEKVRVGALAKAVESFSQAVSFAFFAGLECSEAKVRAVQSEQGRKHEKPEHPLRGPARVAYDLLQSCGVAKPKPSQVIEKMDNSIRTGGKQSLRGKSELNARTLSNHVSKWIREWRRQADG